MNGVPWSDRISQGIPTLEKMNSKASAIEMTVISLRGTASGKPVTKSIRVRIYLWPSDVTGDRGLTMSTATLKNGSVMTGSGFKELDALFLLQTYASTCHVSYKRLGRLLPYQTNKK